MYFVIVKVTGKQFGNDFACSVILPVSSCSFRIVQGQSDTAAALATRCKTETHASAYPENQQYTALCNMITEAFSMLKVHAVQYHLTIFIQSRGYCFLRPLTKSES